MCQSTEVHTTKLCSRCAYEVPHKLEVPILFRYKCHSSTRKVLRNYKNSVINNVYPPRMAKGRLKKSHWNGMSRGGEECPAISRSTMSEQLGHDAQEHCRSPSSSSVGLQGRRSAAVHPITRLWRLWDENIGDHSDDVVMSEGESCWGRHVDPPMVR